MEGLYCMGPELFCWPPGNHEWVANESHTSVAHFCGFQCGTWEAEPSHCGSFGHEDRPHACCILWANWEAFGFGSVPFDEVGEKSHLQLILL